VTADARQAADGERDRRVLVVVDDPTLADAITLALRHRRYARRLAQTTAAAKAVIREWSPDLMLLDIDLDAGAAVHLVDEARGHGRTGVIALARRRNVGGRREAFAHGADDFIAVPLVPGDLVARVRAVMRRTHGTAEQLLPRVRIGHLDIDVLNRTVLADDERLQLTSLEFALLHLLVESAGMIVTRDRIAEVLWGTDLVLQSRAVDRHVQALRAKLHDDWRKPRYIETIHGLGYRFVTTPLR